MKFKVGDRVRFVKSVIYHNKDVKLGKVYTVQDIEERGYMIENKEWFKEKELQKVEYITVNMVNDLGISFPGFEIGKMYKGMERGELYTLEELRL
ncbi:MAG: hypothetical protein ACLUWN_01250 [Clostridia bacterium]|jgi:hypothetical protein|nr:MAG TPA: hypothetical protein [Caudoviricetes sp.]